MTRFRPRPRTSSSSSRLPRRRAGGITRAYSKAVQIGDARTIAAEDYDIKADYEAVHGAVSAGAPKVFFKYFYVNTATGEKSGDMFASAKLGA